MPLITGHPDYQSYADWRGTIVTAQQYTVTIAVPVTVPGNITNFASLLIRCTAPVGGVSVILQFFTDSGMATQVGSMAWTVSGGALLLANVPALGNFFTVQLTTAQAGNQTVNLSILPNNLATSVTKYPKINNAVAGANVSLAAGATFTANLPQLGEGNGYAYFKPLDNTGNLDCRITELNEAGNGIFDLVSATAPLGAVTLQFMSSFRPVQLKVINKDGAAAHNLDYRAQILAQ